MGLTRADGDPVAGWRYWRVDPDDAVLHSVTMRRVTWRPGQRLRAHCSSGHRAPSEGCACGIYGAADLAALHEHGLCLPPGGLVVGRVALWGEVAADPTGWRGELGYPLELSVVEGTVPGDRLAEVVAALGVYGVPVTTTSREAAVGAVSGAIMAFQAMSGGGGCAP